MKVFEGFLREGFSGFCFLGGFEAFSGFFRGFRGFKRLSKGFEGFLQGCLRVLGFLRGFLGSSDLGIVT